MNAGAPLLSSLVGPYRGYRNNGGEWAASLKDFSLRLVCPTENVGAVIGKGGSIIKQIRQESGASIKIDTSVAEGEECIISVSAKEVTNHKLPSPTKYTQLRTVIIVLIEFLCFRHLKKHLRQLMQSCACSHDAVRKLIKDLMMLLSQPDFLYPAPKLDALLVKVGLLLMR